MKTALGSGWTEIATTTTDTAFQADGRWLMSTEDPSATGFEGGVQLNRFESVVIAAGKTVWGFPVEFLYGREQAVNYQEVGV